MIPADAIERALFPCPFCGEKRIFLNPPSKRWPHGAINCPACMVVMPGAIGGSEREPELIAQWNERAALEGGFLAMQDMDSALKDEPILAWCDHEADAYVEDEQSGRLTLYAAHAEGFSYAPTGFHIIEWGGSFDDSTWEYPNGAYLPDWWFVAGTNFEVAANPIWWMPLPVPPIIPND